VTPEQLANLGDDAPEAPTADATATPPAEHLAGHPAGHPASPDVHALLVRATEVCRRAARGDLEARVLHAPHDGDLGDLCHGINQLLDLTDAFVREAAASLEHVSRDQYFRRVIPTGLHGSFRRGAEVINAATTAMQQRSAELTAMRERQQQLATQFEQRVKLVADALAAAAVELHASARALGEASQEAAGGVREVSTAADVATRSVSVLASAAEEMRASIRHVTEQARDASAVAAEASRASTGASSASAELSRRSRAAGDVVRVINGIAAQTKLLALNAAIEASRAGAAGRGFAVVASEVKSLAGEAATATDDVETQLAAIRAAGEDVSTAFTTISDRVSISALRSDAISSAVVEQQTAADEIARSAAALVGSTTQVGDGVRRIDNTATQIGVASGEVVQAAGSLAEMAEQLRGDVDAFLTEIRR
jgi:methyl-accepting chemotaxis protein